MNYKSNISAAIHEIAKDFYVSGLMDAKTMRKFDDSCLEPDKTGKGVRVKIKNEDEYKGALRLLEQDKVVIAHQKKVLEGMNGLSQEEINRGIEPMISFHEGLKEDIEIYESQVMPAFWRVETIRIISDNAISVHFSDGLEGTVLFQPGFFRGVFAHLTDPTLFRQVTVVDGAVTWPGDLDLAPDAMYEEIKQHGEWLVND